MITMQFGEDQWQQVLEASGVPLDSFLTMRSYDDAITFSLASAASEVLGAPVAACLEMFGEHWVLETAGKSYGMLMNATGQEMMEFLGNLNALHDRITSTFLDYVPPEFRVSALPDGRHQIDYISQREGLTPFVVGLLHGLSKHFGNTLTINNQHSQPVSHGEHTVFDVTVTPA
jgi:guanylate cyclase soluble subunit beta